jgi:hypothetical protein
MQFRSAFSWRPPISRSKSSRNFIAGKGFPEPNHAAVAKMVLAPLGALTKRGELAKTGVTRNARWAGNP